MCSQSVQRLRMDPSQAQALARSAFLFTFPLVAMYGRMYERVFSGLRTTSGAGFGAWTETTSTPSTSGLAADLPRSRSFESWLDLRSEPLLLSLPPADTTPLNVRAVDLWGFSVGPPLPRSPDADTVLLAAPLAVKDIPRSVSGVVRGESSCLAVLVDYVTDEPGVDPGAVLPGLAPVSRHRGVPAPAPLPRDAWYEWHPGVFTSDEFWTCANYCLALTRPHWQDRNVLNRIAQLGVVAGGDWSTATFDDEIVEAIEEGIDAALDVIIESAVLRGRTERVSRADFDLDYLARAVLAVEWIDTTTLLGRKERP